MKFNTEVFYSTSRNIWYNLSVEEYFLNTVTDEMCVLFIYQNEPAVVIGKNQNPWQECRTQFLKNEQAKLARRLSGGGAVFHDQGNINVSFICGKGRYEREKQFTVIIEALKKLGISVQLNQRYDLTVENRKFSGSAFCYRNNNVLHHSTLMVSVDVEKLNRCLKSTDHHINSNAVRSTPSDVVNLREITPSITESEVCEALIVSFKEHYGEHPRIICIENDSHTESLEQIYDKHASWEWQYGYTPSFNLTLSNRFSWGYVEFRLYVEKGCITQSEISSDRIEKRATGTIIKALCGSVLSADAIVQSLRSIDGNPGCEEDIFIQDIVHWLETVQL